MALFFMEQPDTGNDFFVGGDILFAEGRKVPVRFASYRSACDFYVGRIPDLHSDGEGRISFVGKDFGAMLRGYVKDNADDSYPLSQTFAIGGFVKPRSVPRLTLFAETDFPRYAEPDLNLGAEYALGEFFRIRAGFTRTWLDISRDFKELASSSSRPDETNEARLFSLGLGYNSSLFAFDYAFSYLASSLGFEHRLGLRVEF